MKRRLDIVTLVVLLCLIAGSTINGLAQAPEKKSLSLQLGYYNVNNQMQYLKASVKTKIEGRFQPVAGVPLQFYITADSPAFRLGNATTNEKGEAVLLIPPSARSEWMRSTHQNFVVTSQATPEFDAANGNVEIVKAKLKLDTTEGRTVTALLTEIKDSTGKGTPVKGVDVTIVARRQGMGINISDQPTYTTDSTGSAAATYQLDSTFPGDEKGNLVLVARVTDNDTYGNLSAEFTVPWGAPSQFTSNFNNRALYNRRGRSPLWLEWMAYSIIVVVWGILIYLVFQIRKVRRIGIEMSGAARHA